MGFHIHNHNVTFNFLSSYKNVDVVAKVENNLATSQKEEMIASPTVSGTDAVVRSLDDSFCEANKVDLNEKGVGNNVAVATVDNNVATSKAEGVGVPFVVSPGNEQVKNCVNS